MGDSKQRAESYDRTHRVSDEDFISSTIRTVDGMLDGERQAEVMQLRKERGRPVSYKSGVSSMGYDEWIGTFLCWQCDQEAEYSGYCEAHYAEHQQEQAEQELEEREEWQAEASDPSGWTASEKAAYDEVLDAEYNDYWNEKLSRWCQLHDVELVNGQCSACISEQEDEVRNDH